MPRLIQSSTARSFIAGLLVASLLSLAAPAVLAADPPAKSDKASSSDASSSTEAREPKTVSPGVLYVAFEGVTSSAVEPAPEPMPTTRPRRAIVNPPPVPAAVTRAAVVSTAPMTVGEKFEAWFKDSFLTTGAYSGAVAKGMLIELRDNDDFKKDTVGNFFADSMTRAARSFAFSTTAGFFEDAVFASLFKQDPRYHRSGKRGTGAKLGYAVTRVFITQGDRCECHQVNASFLLGAAVTTGISNLWERSERTGPRHNISRFTNHIAFSALFNVVREFVGGQ